MADFNSVVFDAAAESGSGDGVERLRAALAAHPDLLDVPNPRDGRTPLHAAAYTGNVEAVQLLLDRGSQSLDALDFEGQTPMHCAATETAAIVEALLRAGSQSLDAPDKDGMTPLHYAAEFGNMKALEALLRAGSQSLDTPDFKGQTPIHWAATAAIVEALLRAGSQSLDALDKFGKTPLHFAAYRGHSVVVEALLRAGSQSLDTPDKSGWTPLHCAASKRQVGTVQTLLKAGADPTIGISDKQRFIPPIRQLLANGPQPRSSPSARASAAPSRAEPSSVVVRPTAAAQQSGTDSPAARSEVERLQAQLRAAHEQLAGEQERCRQLQADNEHLQEQLNSERDRTRQLWSGVGRLGLAHGFSAARDRGDATELGRFAELLGGDLAVPWLGADWTTTAWDGLARLDNLEVVSRVGARSMATAGGSRFYGANAAVFAVKLKNGPDWPLALRVVWGYDALAGTVDLEERVRQSVGCIDIRSGGVAVHRHVLPALHCWVERDTPFGALPELELDRTVVVPRSIMVLLPLAHCNLQQMLGVRRSPLHERELVYLARGLLRGLRHLEQQHVVHRDVKLDNVLLLWPDVPLPFTPSFLAGMVERALLCAVPVVHDLDEHISFADYPDYAASRRIPLLPGLSRGGAPTAMSPEVLAARPPQRDIDFSGHDVWAAGVLLYQLLHHNKDALPYAGTEWHRMTSAAIETTPPLSTDAMPGHYSQPLRQLVADMLHPSLPHRCTLEQALNRLS